MRRLLRFQRRNSTALHGFDLTNCAAQSLHNWSLTQLAGREVFSPTYALHGFDLANRAALRLRSWSLTHLPPEKMILTLFAPCAAQILRSFFAFMWDGAYFFGREACGRV